MVTTESSVVEQNRTSGFQRRNTNNHSRRYTDNVLVRDEAIKKLRAGYAALVSRIENEKDPLTKMSLTIALMHGNSSGNSYIINKDTGMQLDSVEDVTAFINSVNWYKHHREYQGHHIVEYSMPTKKYTAYICEVSETQLISRAIAADEAAGNHLPQVEFNRSGWAEIPLSDKFENLYRLLTQELRPTALMVYQNPHNTSERRYGHLTEAVGLAEPHDTLVAEFDEEWNLLKFQPARILEEFHPQLRAQFITLTPAPSI